jgi:uncharacterized membrane protein YoaK (UPF0700 family)
MNMSSDDVAQANVVLRQTESADALLRELRSRLRVTNTDRALQLVQSRDNALRRQKRLLIVLFVAAVAAPFLIAIRESRWDPVWWGLLYLLPSTAITMWAVARQRTFQSQLDEAGEDFYDQWKRDLRTKIRSTIAGAFVGALLAAAQAAFAVLGTFDIWISIFLGAVSFFTACGVVRVLTVEVSDLRQEYRIVEESCRG